MPYHDTNPPMLTPDDLRRITDNITGATEPPKPAKPSLSPQQELSARLRLQRVLNDVIHEREAQDDKWGPQDHHPLEWLSILGEEVGETCQAANEAYWHKGDWARYRAELIQVAAVAVAMVENIDLHPPD